VTMQRVMGGGAAAAVACATVHDGMCDTLRLITILEFGFNYSVHRYHKGVRHGFGLLTVKVPSEVGSYSLAGEWRKGELNSRVTVTWGSGCHLQANINSGVITAPAFAILKPDHAFVLHEGGWYVGTCLLPLCS
jgi:hypothetical protein